MPKLRPPVALQRCDRFVARTMNWLYDHLRGVRRHTPVVIADHLQNRQEFPDLLAWELSPEALARRLWRRIAGSIYPFDVRRLRRLKPRVLHSHFGYVAVNDRALRNSLGVPWIVGFYGADVYTNGANFESQYSGIFRDAALVLALGPVMKQALQKIGSIPERTLVHPLGVDCDALPSQARVLRPGETLRLLFAGTFREKKGVIYLIHGAALAKKSGVRLQLELVGDEMGKKGDRETKQEIFDAVRTLGLQDVVVHRPFLPFRDLIQLSLQCHVFAAPSVTARDGDAEGTPFVLQQMMATGMPAITTRHSDIPFIFGPHQPMLVPERDAVAIASRIQLYADDPDAVLRDGLLLQERIRQDFNVHLCAGRLSDLYDLAIAGADAKSLGTESGRYAAKSE